MRPNKTGSDRAETSTVQNESKKSKKDNRMKTTNQSTNRNEGKQKN